MQDGKVSAESARAPNGAVLAPEGDEVIKLGTKARREAGGVCAPLTTR